MIFSPKPRLPMVLANESSECALACIAMVAQYHGHQIDLVRLRQMFPLSMTGGTLRGLISLADELHLSPRALRAEMEGVVRLALPAIVHWDLNHWVVLESVKNGMFTVHDPARGVRRLQHEEFSAHYTGVVLELRPSASFAPLRERASLKISDLWTRIQGAKLGLSYLFVFSVTIQIAALALPFLLQTAIDEGVVGSDQSLLLTIAVGFGFIVILQAVIEACRAWTMAVFVNSLSFQVLSNAIQHLFRLAAVFFERRHVGDILSRLQSATAIQNIIVKGALAAVMDGIVAFVALVVMAFYSSKLTVASLLVLGVHMLVMLSVFPFLKRRAEEEIYERSQEQSYLMESVRSAATVKLMGRESVRASGWRNRYVSVVNANLSVRKFELVLAFSASIARGLQIILVITVGAASVGSGQGFTLGMMIAFMSLQQMFTERMLTFVDQVVQFRYIGLHLDRLKEIVHAKPDPFGIEEGRESLGSSFALRNVFFRYGISDPNILKDLNLEVGEGEFIALTGPSGGGKTTLFKMLLGLVEPTSGDLEIGGRAAHPERWGSWRKIAGVVSQEDRLISGTVADNIAFMDPDLDMQRVTEAAAAAQVHEDIQRMPMQYLSLVGDMGSALSGGQKQRILLARALYRKPRILFLDEGTANLDPETEARIVDLIANLSITRVVVAHRPALIERADRVLRLEGGVLSEISPVQRERAALV